MMRVLGLVDSAHAGCDQGFQSMLHARSTLPAKFVFALSLLLPAGAMAQVVTATLTGTVHDSSGASVPNAKVTVTQKSTGTTRTTTSTDDGVYNVPYLEPGNYQVDVEAKGFNRFSQQNLVLDVSTVTRIDATLSPVM